MKTRFSQHTEWLSLIDRTGPFLAVGCLEAAFPQGLDKTATTIRQRVRAAYDEWREAVDLGDPQIGALHREWLRLVFHELLEYDETILKPTESLPEELSYKEPLSGEVVRPDFAVMAGDKARMLVLVLPPESDPNAPVRTSKWSASPIERMTALCRATGVEVGIVTDGERWSVVGVPKDGTSSVATWYARIWHQEPITLQAFQSLLTVRRCFGEEAGTLDALLRKSLEHQDEVTDTLGEQVRRAVEVLVQALDRADEDRNRELLKDISEPQLYEAGLTVMMRLVFLMCAEERGLLLLGEPIYDQFYAVTTLRARLREDADRLGLEVLDRRQDAWSRLLATFRAVHGGIEHETLRLPALGGSLFDPDRFPFLEGRPSGTSWRDTPAVPLPIDNRTVLLLLTALQVLEQSSGAQLLSYQALDVEQIGHVYEGLLERTVKRVPEITLGLQGTAKVVNPNASLAEIEAVADEDEDTLAAWVKEQTGRNVKRALSKPVDANERHLLLHACGGDGELAKRIEPFFHLLRTDSWGEPIVYRAGSFVVTMGQGRRETGTHYTPKSLTEPIVKHTLEPLVYVGPAEGKPQTEWKLKAPPDILALKVCDMAMGSAAFLVQACRWMAERLTEAWAESEADGKAISIEGEVLDSAAGVETMPEDRSERLLLARRLIASRCLYGVDINPMAVELAKLSLWLITMQKNRPFNFLDHALKCGDSLLGVSDIKQLENFSIRAPDTDQPLFDTANLWRHTEQAAELRRKLESLPSHTTDQIAEKACLHAEAEALTAKLKTAADFLVAAELDSPDERTWQNRRVVAASHMQAGWKRDVREFRAIGRSELNGKRTFHWAVEFPEVFAGGGFDASFGNPPFMGGRKMRGNLGGDYLHFVTDILFHRSSANADLCAFFFRRSFLLLRPHGVFGLLATNTIAQGDTLESGLATITANGGVIFRAISSAPWPGAAGVKVAQVWGRLGAWESSFVLDGKSVVGISASLRSSDRLLDKPHQLSSNVNKSFQGSIVLGLGFVLTPEEANELIMKDPRNREVLNPYLTGADLNTYPDQSPSRWVINFHDWPLEEKHDHSDNPKGPPYAADYPDCLRIVEENVKPERQRKKPDGTFALRKPLPQRWWHYADKRPALYAAIRSMPRVLCKTRHSPNCAFELVKTGIVFQESITVFAVSSFDFFAVLSSTIHEFWAWQYGSTLGDKTLRYSSSDCFDTFPFPNSSGDLALVGERYYNFRSKVMLAHQEGLTKTYNRFHDWNEQSANIARLRALHKELDEAVAASYGWSNLDLDHGFHETTQGIRYTISESARQTVLDRLLTLNHQRYEEEVKAGLHDKKAKKTTGGKRGRKAEKDETQELDL